MLRADRVALAILAALFAHWSANVWPLVRFGATAVPGFAVAAVAGSLALLVAVVWFMVVRPMVVPPRYVRGVRV